MLQHPRPRRIQKGRQSSRTKGIDTLSWTAQIKAAPCHAEGRSISACCVEILHSVQSDILRCLFELSISSRPKRLSHTRRITGACQHVTLLAAPRRPARSRSKQVQLLNGSARIGLCGMRCSRCMQVNNARRRTGE